MYLFGSVVNVDGSSSENAVTLITDMHENANGLIFTASSYHEDYSNIEVGLTIPFRAQNYFCQTSGENTNEAAYRYLLTMAEFRESSILSD
ncbi:TPA: hypothetical protein ACTWZ9_000945 [Raoultella planticola]